MKCWRFLVNIYVGNLSWGMSDNDLQKTFEEYGSVDSARVVTDRDTGRSRGFGFVEMSDNSEGAAAIQGLNGMEVDGRALKVNEANPRN
jgi:RNA recognition motif-containing protein